MRLTLLSQRIVGGAAGRDDATETRIRSWEATFLVALFLAVVAPTSILAAIGRFDGLYGQDPYAYADYAALLRRAGPLHLLPLPPFYWPPGYPLAVALVSVLGPPVPLAGRIVSAVAGGLVPVFTYLLAKELVRLVSRARPHPTSVSGVTSRHLFKTVTVSSIGCRLGAAYGLPAGMGPPLVPAIAGLVTACQAQLWQSSAVVMADTLGLVAATAGVWGLARYGQRRALPWLLVASVAVALAILTRWAYALVAIPCATYAVLVVARLPRRVAARDAAAAFMVGAAILAPMLAPLIAGLGHNSHAAPFAADLQVYTWNPLNALRRTFVTADGLLSYRVANGLYYAIAPARPVFFTPLLVPLILAGLWCVARRPTLEVVVLVVGWAAVIYAFHAGAPWQNFRFTLAYLPPLAILLALGASALRIALGRWGSAAIGLVLVAGLGWMVASGVLLVRGFIAQKDADLATVAWLDHQGVPSRAHILTFGLTETLLHYSHHPVTDLSEAGPSDLAAAVDGREPAYVVLDVQNVESQWRGRAPSVNYHRLLDRHLLVRRGEHPPYALDQVCSAATTCAVPADAPG